MVRGVAGKGWEEAMSDAAKFCAKCGNPAPFGRLCEQCAADRNLCIRCGGPGRSGMGNICTPCGQAEAGIEVTFDPSVEWTPDDKEHMHAYVGCVHFLCHGDKVKMAAMMQGDRERLNWLRRCRGSEVEMPILFNRWFAFCLGAALAGFIVGMIALR